MKKFYKGIFAPIKIICHFRINLVNPAHLHRLLALLRRHSCAGRDDDCLRRGGVVITKKTAFRPFCFSTFTSQSPQPNYLWMMPVFLRYTWRWFASRVNRIYRRNLHSKSNALLHWFDCDLDNGSTSNNLARD